MRLGSKSHTAKYLLKDYFQRHYFLKILFSEKNLFFFYNMDCIFSANIITTNLINNTLYYWYYLYMINENKM